VGKVFPEWLFTKRLLMKSLVGPTATGTSFGTVAISFTPFGLLKHRTDFPWGRQFG
jgi:hypothetical protein